MNTNTIELKEYRLKFKLEPNFLEERKIQQTMAEIAGGWDKLAELEAAIANAYSSHLEYNKAKFGEDFSQLQKRYLELDQKDLEGKATQEESSELRELGQKLNKNKFYSQYLSLVREKSNLYNYAMLSVLCVEKPEGFEFLDQKEATLIKIWFLFEEAKKKTKEQQ